MLIEYRTDGMVSEEYIPLIDVDMLVIVGSGVSLSSASLLMLARAGVPVLIHDREADCALHSPFMVRIAEVRRRLYAMTLSQRRKLKVARALISGKLWGMTNVARYLVYRAVEKGRAPSITLDDLQGALKDALEEVGGVRDVPSLISVEAKWSRRLWEALKGFVPEHYGFRGRNPEARDPVNSSLNYTYAILYALCSHALTAAGLDPYAGLLHSKRAGKPSLALDLSEMFKPAAIHAVISASRSARLEVAEDGYLTKDSLGVVTAALFRNLGRKLPEWEHSVRGYIYAKAWELRLCAERGDDLKPFVYRVK